MIKSAEYIQFEEGFLKIAEEQGCDVKFMRGYLKEADEIVEIWKNAFDELEQEYSDPQYKTKIASEIIRMTMMSDEIYKQAGFADIAQGVGDFTKGLGEKLNLQSADGTGGAQGWLQGKLGDGPGFMGQIGNFLKQNPNMLTSLLTGAGGGGLAGLLIGALLKHPMAGLMLGGLVGAGGSAFMGNQNLRNMFNAASKPTAPATPAAGVASTPAPGAAAPGAVKPTPPPIPPMPPTNPRQEASTNPVVPPQPITPPKPGLPK